MFQNAYRFNNDISKWYLKKVTTTKNMFNNATSFNGNITNWKFYKINDISYMFKNAKSFNRDLSHWRFYNNYGPFIVLETKDMFLDSGLEIINIPMWYKNIYNQSNYI